MLSREETTKIYAVNVCGFENRNLYLRAYNAVSEGRREKTDRLYSENDKRLSIGAEILLQYALKDAGISPLPPSFEIDANGKPYLAGRTIQFNLSHSGDFAVCAVSQNSVGCDIEKEQEIDLEVSCYFHRDEYESIMSIKDKTKRLKQFYRYWTLKESYVKARGLGMALPFDSFKIIFDHNIAVDDPSENEWFSFKDFSEIPGYYIAVCTKGKISHHKLITVELADIISVLENS